MKPEKKCVGRPKVPLDWDRIAEMYKAGCSTMEIARTCKVSERSLYERCQLDKGIHLSDFTHQFRAMGDITLRETQYKLAVEGKDRGMLIWLGKQRLGQKENPESKEEFNGKLAELLKMMKELKISDSELERKTDTGLSR